VVTSREVAQAAERMLERLVQEGFLIESRRPEPGLWFQLPRSPHASVPDRSKSGNLVRLVSVW